MRKYMISGQRHEIVKLIFKLKNKISVAAARTRRYDVQERSRKQNETFAKNRKQFYRDIGTEENIEVDQHPSEEDLKEFWGNQIWGQSNLYNPAADWIPAWRKEYVNIKEQEWNDICETDLKAQLNKQMNWKAPGIDLLPNYWLKNLDALHAPLAKHLNKCVTNPELTPLWLVTGKSTLLPKND